MKKAFAIIILFFTTASDVYAGLINSLRAHRSFKSGDYASSEEYYRESLKRNESFRNRYNLGTVQLMKGKAEEAADNFLEASVASSRIGSRARHNLALLNYLKGDKEAALSGWRSLLREDPNDELARYNLEVALRTEAEKEAAEESEGETENEEESEPEKEELEAEYEESTDAARMLDMMESIERSARESMGINMPQADVDKPW